MRGGRFHGTEHGMIDLAAILTLYVAWFERGGLDNERLSGKTSEDHKALSGKNLPSITVIEDTARRFLSENLAPSVPAYFALSVIESIAYTTSKFASADRANASLYTATALQILREGFKHVSEQ